MTLRFSEGGNPSPRIYNPSLTLAQNRNNIDARRPIQDFQTIYRWMHGLNSSYNALQVTVDKRYSKGFTISGAYTWSKNLDYVSRNEFGGSFGINNPNNFSSHGENPISTGLTGL